MSLLDSSHDQKHPLGRRAKTVKEDLHTWGPETSPNQNPLSLPQAEVYCQRLATAHYENFPVVTWLLPSPYRQPFYNVYAFCRWADDLGDEIGDPQESQKLLGWWRFETNRCFEGEASHPVFIALRETIRQHSLQRSLFLDLISAFEQDQTQTRYETFDSLLDYCSRSANPVGRILLQLLGQTSDQHLVWSDAICTGLQLANFWQDVQRDFQIGRIYLPQEDLRQFEYSESDLKNRIENRPFHSMMEFEVRRARSYLMAGLPLGRHLPGRIGWEIELFAQGGLAILNKIEQRKYRILSERPKIRMWDGFLILLRLFRRFLPE